MPQNARKTRWYSTGGPWGSGLMCLGLAAAAQGLAYIFSNQRDLTDALGWITKALPVPVYGMAWLAVGVYSIWKALTPPQNHRDIVPAVAIVSLWAGIYFAHWLVEGLGGHWSREWAVATAWASLSLVLVFFGACSNPPRGRRRGR